LLDRILDERRQEIASELSESNFFEVFSAEQVLKDYDLSYEELRSGIVGNGNDGGIDSLYLFVNGELVTEDYLIGNLRQDIAIELHIIQSKRETTFSELALQRLRTTTEELFNLDIDLATLRPRFDAKILTIVGLFRNIYQGYLTRFPKLGLYFHYASRGTHIHPNVLHHVDLLRSTVARLFSDAHFDFVFWDALKLRQRFFEMPVANLDLNVAELMPYERSSYVGLVRLGEFNRFLTDDHGRIRKNVFEANVRDYQGNVEVNRDIQETLQHPQGEEDFWWLNNGVTIIASKASASGKTLALEAPQIVNGLQTSTEIHKYLSSRKAPDYERNILVRVIVTTDAGVRDRIIEATNKQSSIPRASLRATDPIHRDIEEYLKGFGYFYDRRKNYYKNAGKPINRIIGIAFLAQAVMSVLLRRPDDARARPSTLLKDDANYELVFNKDYPINVYYTAIEIMLRVTEYLKSREENLSSAEINNIRFHLAMFVALYLTRTVGATTSHLSNLEVSTISSNLLDNCFDETWTIYSGLGGNDQVAKGVEFPKALIARLQKLLSNSEES